jgi:glycosyltransferase involved in cell wall biosynthesis
MRKCVVGHAGARDYNQIALSFEETGLLSALVTDFYIPPSLNKIFRLRDEANIPFGRTKVSSRALYEFIKEKSPLTRDKRNYVKKDRAISKKSLEHALLTDSNLFLYSYYAYEAFSYIKSNTLDNKCFLFQLHPHPLSVKKILLEEADRLPFAKESIDKEAEFSIDNTALKQLSEEVHLSDQCVVASSFTRTTLIENGADSTKVKVIPYGVDLTRFPQKSSYSMQQTLNVIFIGSMVQRKGLADLLAAIRKMKTGKINVTLIGRTIIDKSLLDHFSDVNFKVKVNIDHRSLLIELHNSDVFVFPSLVEGFGHVILEAMATGLPVITTTHTAGVDVIADNEDGFIIPVKSPDAIAEKLEILMTKKTLCKEIGNAANLKAKTFTWERFRKDLVAFYLKHS